MRMRQLHSFVKPLIQMPKTDRPKCQDKRVMRLPPHTRTHHLHRIRFSSHKPPGIPPPNQNGWGKEMGWGEGVRRLIPHSFHLHYLSNSDGTLAY